jgi:hypothetical protein
MTQIDKDQTDQKKISVISVHRCHQRLDLSTKFPPEIQTGSASAGAGPFRRKKQPLVLSP